MPYIDKCTIDKVFDAAEGRIIEIIGDFVSLKKAGTVYKGLSPFAEEKTPSFVVSPAKNIFKDFSTGIGGTTISFLMQKGYSYPEAIEYIAKKYNIDIVYRDKEKMSLEQREQHQKIANSLEVLSEVNSIFQAELKQNIKAYDYLINRGLTKETIADFQFGVHPKQLDLKILPDFNSKAKILTEELGLLYVNFEKAGYHHSFAYRITVPYFKANGNIVGFTARTLYSKTELAKWKQKYDNSIAKWKNSKQSTIFDKSKLLFGIHLAKNEIRIKKFAYLVEGAFDVAMVYQLGYKNVVAANGTALTDNHILELKKYTDTICLLYDGDQRDNEDKAIIKNAIRLIDEGFSVTVKILPKDQDPGDYFSPLLIKLPYKPKALFQFKSYITTEYKEELIFQKESTPKDRFTNIPEVDFMDYYLPFLINQTNSKKKKAENISKIAKILSSKTYDKTRILYIKEVQNSFDINKSEWTEYYNEVLKSKRKKSNKNTFTKNLVKTEQQLIAVNTEENRKKHDFYFLTFDKSGNFLDIDFDDVKFLSLLKNRKLGFGFFRYTNDIGNHLLVQIVNNQLSIVDPTYINDVFRKYISELKPLEHEFLNKEGFSNSQIIGSELIMRKMLKKKKYLFDIDMLYQLEPDNPIVIKEDDEHAKFFYRKNGFVKITKNNIELKHYKELDGFIWDDMVVDRDFKPKVGTDGVVAKFINNICNSDPKRVKSLNSIIGYLTHFYFKIKLVEIVFTDAALTKDSKSNGQSGKDLINDLIGYTINKAETSKTYVSIDGTQLKKNDKNKYSAVEINTKLVTFSDIYPNFDLRDHFVQIRKGWLAQQMYKDAMRIITKTSLSTNKSLKMDGPSYFNRIIPFELWNYYDDKRSPEDEFGHRFMDDWDKPEFINEAYKWDNYVFSCAQLFIKNNLKPIRPALINLQRRELYDHTSPEFVDWMDFMCSGDQSNNFISVFKYYDKDNDNTRYYKKELFESFTKQSDNNDLRQRKFNKWLSMYFENQEITIEEKKYGGQAYIRFLNGLGKRIKGTEKEENFNNEAEIIDKANDDDGLPW